MRKHRATVSIAGVLAIVTGAALAATSCGDDDPVVGTAGGTAGAGGSSAGTAGAAGSEAGGAGTAGAAGSETEGGVVGEGGVTTEGGQPSACATLTTVTVDQDIAADTTWTACNVYVLPAEVRLLVKSNATLTVEPGTTVRGQRNSILVVTRGSKIIAEGTKERPIVFTSDQPEGMKSAGGWGGLVIMGNAPINNNKLSSPPGDEATFEAFPPNTPAGVYGGTDPADNSGVLKYVRVEFGGFAFSPDREFNGITLCGVGSGTTIDFIQAHGGADDGVEIFGGTVNLKHVVSSQNQDDGFDTDNGWQGKLQFLIVQNLDPVGSPDASNGYESDGHPTAFVAEPRTMPTIYNATILGKKDYTGGTSFAAIFRRGTGGKYFNHIFAGFQRGIEVRDPATADQITAGNLFVKNSIIFNGPDGVTWPAAQMANDIVEKPIFENPEWVNRQVEPGLPEAAYNRAAPSFKPAAGSAALTGGATPPADGFFDATATFVGAIGEEDWTAGWTSYPQPPVQ